MNSNETFLATILKVMRETVPKGALEMKGAYVYSFYDREIGRLASAGGLGWRKMAYENSETMPTLKFSEPIADTGVDKDHRPSLKRGPG
jgi:hypothetical protein